MINSGKAIKDCICFWNSIKITILDMNFPFDYVCFFDFSFGVGVFGRLVYTSLFLIQHLGLGTVFVP
jgi:hypothetical protein